MVNPGPRSTPSDRELADCRDGFFGHSMRDFAATTLSQMRDLLSDLHHEIDNRGGREGELFRAAEETIRWLLDEYLARGELMKDD